MISKVESARRWRLKYPEKAKKLSKKCSELSRFGVERINILERDKYQCRSCGKKEGILDIHHIDGNGSGKKKLEKNNSLDNLVTLCRRCHKIAEMAILMKKADSTWALKHKSCIICGKTDSKHSSGGKCNRCTNRERKEYKAKLWREKYKFKTK